VTEFLLLVAGVLGGAVNSLAGGGSFIVFPALLFAGVPPVVANASNTYAALPGYVSGTAGYWKDMVRYKERLLVWSLVSLAFGYVGAELLLVVSDETFSQIVPWLMLAEERGIELRYLPRGDYLRGQTPHRLRPIACPAIAPAP
jgi:uncharacterized membrane protein YfcA